MDEGKTAEALAAADRLAEAVEGIQFDPGAYWGEEIVDAFWGDHEAVLKALADYRRLREPEEKQG